MRRAIPPHLGPVSIPPIPQWIAMVDRADGTVWYLSHQVSDQRFGITDSPPPHKQLVGVRHYSAFEGPILAADGADLRLLIRSGRIGYETISRPPARRGIQSSPATTRRGNGSLVLTALPLTWQADGDAIGYEVTRA